MLKNTEKVLFIDIYIPDLSLAIEYDGKQHYSPINFFGGNDGFNIQSKRDLIKTEYCIKNYIELNLNQYHLI